MLLTRHLIWGFARLFVIRHLLAGFARLATLLCRSQGALAAEHLFLRKQLARFQERKVKPHRATDATRFLMALLGRFFNWRSALVVVKPDNLPDRFRPGRRPDPKPRGMTFVPNHAQALVACDFVVVVTARFRILYVFVVMEVGTGRIVHHNVTAHPTAEWTLQQFREALPGDHAYRFVIHDRDRIYWKDLDQAVEAMGVRVLRTPVRAPKGNSLCELTRFLRPPHVAIRFPRIAASGRSPCWELYTTSTLWKSRRRD